MSARLGEIVGLFGGDLVGDASLTVDGVATLEFAAPGKLSFLSNPKYRSKLAATRASAVILSRELAGESLVPVIVTKNPYLYFARVAQWFNPLQRPSAGVHPSAAIESEVPESACVGPNVWIGESTVIGENVVIGANCCIGDHVEIGAGSWLYPGVSIYSGCRVGANAILHSGVVIGSDGFGFAREDTGAWVKIPQTGAVVIGDDVEIGANTTIDRGALEDTVIGDGVKLDNQVQVGHNVHIGAHTAMAGCVGIAGSTHIGARCTLGGAAVILGHLNIADGVNVSAGTLVAKSIAQPGSYTGTVPFMAHDAWLKNFSRLRHLDTMADKIRTLEARLLALEQGRKP